MERGNVSRDVHNEKRSKDGFLPDKDRNQCRKKGCKKQVKPRIIVLLKLDNRVFQEVVKVQDHGLLFQLRMLLPQKPTDVSKEEPSMSVVRISVSLTELVMHSVVSTPNIEGVLPCNALTDHQEDSKEESCIVGLV
jgi:hypothetical protein